MKWTLLVAFLLFALLGLVPVSADDKPDKPKQTPKAKLPLGRETTFVVGPLDKDGYIDYESALNAELGRGITREKNANVLLWMTFGPTPEGSEMSAEFYRWLDIPPPPKGGDYFISISKIARDRLALTDAQLEGLFEQYAWATMRPWAAKDYSVIAAWLKENEKPIALAVEATKRPQYFNPLVSRRKEDEPSNLIGAFLPSVQRCRDLASALSARAMLRVHEGKFDDAWQDLLACQRLGRLVSRGATLIESLVGVAICQIANNATVAYLVQAKLTSKQVAERMKELRSLPPLTPVAGKVDIFERLVGLDALQNMRRDGADIGYVLSEVFGENNPLSAEEKKALTKIDWTPTMQSMNKWYDRIAAAMRIKDRIAREKEFNKIEEELVAVRSEAAKAGNLTKLLAGKNPDKTAGKVIGDTLMALLAPSVRRVQTAHDRAEQAERNLHVAFALAAYHADNGKYPAELDDLAPDYLATVPGDLFSGKTLIYKLEKKGYIVYSVGPNGKDDGGRWYDDMPPGDDPSVKMPLPEKKK